MAITIVLGRILLAGLAALTLGELPAFAQARATTADLSGVVLDQSKAVLPGATVTARNTATGVERAVVTGRDGRYIIAALPPGTYLVTAALAGFATEKMENVRLALGQSAELDIPLQIAGTSEVVTVVARPAMATVGQTAVATAISERQIETLPANGRNFLSFSTLTPGVNTDRTPQQGAASTSGLTFAGQRARSNNITVDGLDNNDSSTNSVRATFSQEGVQEFQVIANSYPAEFGKVSGGVVNIATKSGTNTYAGNIFAFFRHDALNAKEHFEKYAPDGTALDQAKAPYSQYQVGGTFGGPIRRNRSFFFLSAERLRVGANNFVNIDDVNPIVVFGRDYGTVVDVLRADNFPVEVGHVPYRVESDQILAKVDTVLNPVHHLALRFNWGALLDENAEPWGGQVAESAGAYLDSHDLMGAASLTSAFSATTLNELRLQVANRDRAIISLDPTCTGVCDRDDEGGPALSIGDIQVGRQFMTPQPSENRRYQVVDTLSHVVGHHQLKTGFDFSYVDLRSMALPRMFGGRYVFPNVQTLALDRPVAYVQGYGNPTAAGGFSDISLFAEDQWRVRDDLTLRLGVRYQNQFWPRMTAKVGDLSYGWPADNNNVAPRLAVSWNPLGSEKTSVYGAYGVFYDNHFMALWTVPVIASGTEEHVRMKQFVGADAVAGWNASDRRLPEPAAYYSDAIAIDPGLRTPYAHHASVGLEREFAGNFTMSVHFVYVRGFDQAGAIEYNPVIDPATGARPLDENGPGTSALSVWQFTSWAETWYRGLTFSIRKRFSGRSQFLASYTLSKAEDLANDYAFMVPQDNGFGRDPADPKGLPLGFDPMLERGPSLQDQRQRFVLSGLYILPADLTLSGIVTVGSGRPFNIVAGTDMNGDRIVNVQPDRARRVRDDPATSVSRNAGLLPATSSVDLRVSKRLALAGRARLDLIVEMFNLLNHTNYTQVNAVFGPGAYPDNPNDTFGQFTKAGPPFQAQVAAKVLF